MIDIEVETDITPHVTVLLITSEGSKKPTRGG
jgi:hypothetical protein